MGTVVPPIATAHASGVAYENTAEAIFEVDVNAGSSVAVGNPSGVTPMTSKHLRSEYSKQRLPSSTLMDLRGGDFPSLRSVSGTRYSGKGGFWKSNDVPMAGIPSGELRESRPMGDSGLPGSFKVSAMVLALPANGTLGKPTDYYFDPLFR